MQNGYYKFSIFSKDCQGEMPITSTFVPLNCPADFVSIAPLYQASLQFDEANTGSRQSEIQHHL